MRQIKFSKQVADGQENYVHSLKQGEEYRKAAEIHHSVKAGIKEFLKNKDFLINLALSMALWFITIMNYQVNAYYAAFFPGD